MKTLSLATAPRPAKATNRRPTEETPEERGYRLLLNKAYLPSDFDQEVFDNLWRTWEEPARSEAAKAGVERRREMAFSRYGLTPRPGSKDGKPLQYVVDAEGRWSINCFACHGGKVAGRMIPGLPNSHFAMQTLSNEVRAIKLTQGKLSLRDVAGGVFPLGETNGTTNAVMFGLLVGALRDKDLNFDAKRPLPKFKHHDLEAPPWWNTHKKKWFYIDGSSRADHRTMMQFVLSSSQNSGKTIRGWEDDFKDIYAWIRAQRPPKYPYAVDRELAASGRLAFKRVCAECHGAYGDGGAYPERMVDIDEVGTDRVRFDALNSGHKSNFHESWLSYYGKFGPNPKVTGYVAPPLDGIWASAPYFHNGAVPTLWHVMHADQRPVVWKRTENGYDQQRVGLEIATYDELPEGVKQGRDKRRYFDTRLFGKGAAGHRFPESLTAAEKRAVLEYLKTL